eukprot:TRINITY_DN5933_c0_g1_i1.p1 TRINITY_DN5933_c0_g1~~TRINITY_DN5933_c0_g1_i1.p1  ORF type:complete len:537 (+),score=114.94 TRINITY_DN5933_c0_g1_i1:70-1680(+)
MEEEIIRILHSPRKSLLYIGLALTSGGFLYLSYKSLEKAFRAESNHPLPVELEIADDEEDEGSEEEENNIHKEQLRISIRRSGTANGSDPNDTAPINEIVDFESLEYPFDVVADAPWNIQYAKDNNGSKIIRAANIFKLVEKLTEESGQGTSQYTSYFLLTYRSFATPTQLLQLLIKRYNVPVPPDLTEHEAERFVKNYKKHIQIRVWYVLKTWSENHFYDFQENPELITTYLDFIHSTMMLDMQTLSVQLKQIVDKKVHNRTIRELKRVQSSKDIPRTIEPLSRSGPSNTLVLIDIDPLEVARQLTLIEYDLYSKIIPKECLNQNWTRPDKEALSPHVVALIERFNTTSNWVITTVVSGKTAEDRAMVVEKFIEIAQHARELRNFNTMMGLVAGLMSSNIGRLKKTWELVPKEVASKFESECSVMLARNYKVLRDAVKQSLPPCLPYLGIYLSDAVFVEDGNSDYVMVNDLKLINFEKRLMLARIITDLRLYQQKSYVLAENEEIKEFLNECFKPENILNEKASYAKSLECEPRK